ncbi:MAG: DUF1330 domain-containing protein [Pseudomonadota bacterium]
MPKAYWIAHVDVMDARAYEKYRAANATAFEKYGAKFLVRGGDQEVREGSQRKRSVVIEFKDRETAVACYESPEYQMAKAHRNTAAVSDLVIIDGYDS